MKTLLSTYLHELHIPFTRSYADKLFAEHPYRYNLYGLSDMLSVYKIENAGIQVEDKDLRELASPFVAHVSNDFVVVRQMSDQAVDYVWREKEISVPVDEFKKLWSGIALVAEPGESSREPEYEKHRETALVNSVQKIGIIMILVVLLVLGSWEHHLFSSVTGGFLLFINLAGVGVSFLLLLKQGKVQSEYTDKICSLFKQGDCNSVLESDAAKLGGMFSWSEIGLGYFISSLTLVVFYPQWMPYLMLVNLLSLPYTGWSVWYQYKVAKQWCPLCLSVLLLLWMTAVVNVFGQWRLPTFEMQDMLSVAILYLLPFLALHLLSERWFRSEQLENVKYELNNLKASESVFLSQMELQPHYKVNLATSQIVWGCPQAKLRITVLTNPHCNPCAQMHKRIGALLREMGDKVCVQYIFSSFNKELEKSARFLLAVYQQENYERAEAIYNDWFAGKKYLGETYMLTFDYDLESMEVNRELNKHKEWQLENRLTATPTVLINGYQLPDSYKIEDMRHFGDLNINQ